MEEEITRASSSASTGRRKTSSSSSSSAKKKTSSSSSTAKKKPASSASSSKKKPSSSTSSNRKTSSSSSIRLSAQEKKIITNFRKCGTLQKKIIELIIEKVAGGTTKLEGIERLIDDQSDLL